MEYKIYKLEFQTAVHFGKQRLEEGEYTCGADTVFSALCQEALLEGENELEQLYQYGKAGALLFSDAFPYMGSTLFLPKPMKRMETESRGNSVVKKAYKKLKYIPAEEMENYLRGQYDVLKAPDMDKLGHFAIKTSAAVRGQEETMPYRIGTYSYEPGNGLYLIVGYRDRKALELAEMLLEQLSYDGIGGKRSAGLGRFVLRTGKMPSLLCERLSKEGKRYMTLAGALPTEEELEKVLPDAEYLLCKRSGFVASDRYAPEQMRKKDLYIFKAGSCFSAKFQGDIVDVSEGGTHPVYRYAKPMFMVTDMQEV